ncbi:MAG: threonine synthase [Chlamydiota bacterium]|nr:threonine synthase [Chlamydiota bacterium]
MDSTFKLYSTKNHDLNVSLKEAIFHGLAQDGGLFLPKAIPKLSADFFREIKGKSFIEVSFEVARHLLVNEIPERKLLSIIENSFPFTTPIVEVEKNIFSQELFHGPTLSFKDFGARFMARLFQYYLNDQKRELNILVATSGDTGSAVADGFSTIPGIKVWILYPSKKISRIQEQQMTTLADNINAVEVSGTFDDCQKLVKQAFADKELRAQLNITSANSINIARLIPQTFYYFYLFSQLEDDSNIVVSVPSGNFGNLTAGIVAKKMGLPLRNFVAATNINDVFPEYLDSGSFSPRPSKQTISNAMDVGNPSNFERLQDLFHDDIKSMRENIYGARFTDDQTRQAIKFVYENTGYIMDPHGAVAYLGLKQYKDCVNKDIVGVFLETAHPAKFAETVEAAIQQQVTIPQQLMNSMNKEKKSTLIGGSYSEFKALLM